MFNRLFNVPIAANSYELNNLDNDVLDAPTVYSIGGVNGEGSQFPTTSSDEYATDPDSVILADTHVRNSQHHLLNSHIF